MQNIFDRITSPERVYEYQFASMSQCMKNLLCILSFRALGGLCSAMMAISVHTLFLFCAND